MKKIILIAGALLLVGCGPSQQEKELIAGMACAEIMATRNFEEARRIKILNEARLEVGLEPIVSSSLFETNIRLGGRSSCIDYIIPPPPKTRRQIAKEQEQQRIAKEKREKIEEENRIKWEEEERKRAEERKIKEEEERIAREERERQEEQRRLEEERLKAEKIRLAEEKKIREEEERRRYVEENTVTTHLYCPSLEKKSRRSKDPKYNKGFVINRLDDKYLMSDAYLGDTSRTPLPDTFSRRSCEAEDKHLNWQEYFNRYQKRKKDWFEGRESSEHPQELLGGEYSYPSGLKTLFCEKVGSVVYSLLYHQVIPELQIVSSNYPDFVENDLVLIIGSWYTLNRNTLMSSGVGGPAPCQVVTKEEFESKVTIPLKEKFDSFVEPAKQQNKLLQEQLQQIEKKI